MPFNASVNTFLHRFLQTIFLLCLKDAVHYIFAAPLSGLCRKKSEGFTVAKIIHIECQIPSFPHTLTPARAYSPSALAKRSRITMVLTSCV